MKHAAVVLGCLLLATPAAAQITSDKAQVKTTRVSVMTADFLKQVTVSDLFETATARLALANGGDAEKQFATKMLEDHGKTSAELKRIAIDESLDIALPTQMDAAHQAKHDELKNARGDQFSSIYASQQVEAHQQAVALFERYASSGDHAGLKDWAGKTVPALKRHLEMAQQLGQGRSAPTVGSSPAK